MSQKTRKESLITVVGTNYGPHLLPELIEKCFPIYSQRDFAKKSFQVSILENTYSTAGILLAVLGLEAYRNRCDAANHRRAPAAQ